MQRCKYCKAENRKAVSCKQHISCTTTKKTRQKQKLASDTPQSCIKVIWSLAQEDVRVLQPNNTTQTNRGI